MLFQSVAAIAAGPVLSSERYGVIRFGEPLAKAESLLSEHVLPAKDKDELACRFVRFHAYPEAKFMVEDGLITRADVSSKVRNNLNINVGARLNQVKRTYPSVQIEPHQYDPNGQYLIFKSPDKKTAIVMEVSDGKVTDVRAGVESSVEYVEECL